MGNTIPQVKVMLISYESEAYRRNGEDSSRRRKTYRDYARRVSTFTAHVVAATCLTMMNISPEETSDEATAFCIQSSSFSARGVTSATLPPISLSIPRPWIELCTSAFDEVTGSTRGALFTPLDISGKVSLSPVLVVSARVVAVVTA